MDSTAVSPLDFGLGESSRRYAAVLRRMCTASNELQFCVSTQISLISPHSGAIKTVDVDKVNCNFAIFGGSDGKASLFDLRPGFKSFFRKPCQIKRLSLSMRGHSAAVSGIEWFPKDCGIFATCSYDATVKIWDTEAFSPVIDFAFSGSVNCCRMHHDGKLIGCAIKGNDIKLCDLRTGGSTHVLSSHRRLVTGLDFCPSNANILVSSSLDKSVKLFDIRKGSTKAVIMSLDWRHDSISRRDAAGGRGAARDDIAIAHDGGAMSVRFASCGTVLVTTGADQSLRVWDPATGSLIDSRSNIATSLSNSPYQIDISSRLPGLNTDDILLFPGKVEGSIAMSILDRQKSFSLGSRIQCLLGHVRMVNGVRYLPLRNKIISIGSDGLMAMWEPVELNARSGSSFSGNDPEGNCRPVISKSVAREVFNRAGPHGADVDNWSDTEEPAALDGATAAQQLEGSRFLPPIIRQILDEERRATSSESTARGSLTNNFTAAMRRK